MPKPIKSRDGLTRCASCRTHILAEETPSETTCPFCGANLHRSRARAGFPTGRGGVLAASLFAFTAVGCGGDSGGDEPSTVEPVDDTSGADTSADGTGNDNTPDDGTANDQYADDPADDNTAVAEYGMPADEPMYGMPPG